MSVANCNVQNLHIYPKSLWYCCKEIKVYKNTVLTQVNSNDLIPYALMSSTSLAFY